MLIFPSDDRRTAGRRRSGAAAVELTILVPVLAILILGTFEFSRGLLVKEVLQDAARKACRTASRPGKDNPAVTQDARDVLAENQIDAARATVKVFVNGKEADVKTAKQGDRVAVQVSVPVSEVYWTTTLLLKSDVIESETVVMMRQG